MRRTDRPRTLPTGVRALAEAERLGDLVHAYEPGQRHRRARVWLFFFIVPGLILLPFTVHYVLGGVGYASVLSLLLTVAYLGAAGRLLVNEVLPVHGSAAYLFEQGLVHRAGRRSALAFRWDAITEVRVSGVRRGAGETVAWRFTLLRDDGRETVFGSELVDAGALLERVSGEVTERLLPKYIARVEGGGSLQIGPFTVSGDGITKAGWTVPWPGVHAVGMDGGTVYVSRSDGLPAMTVPAGQLPNAVAFIALVEYLAPVVRPGGPP